MDSNRRPKCGELAGAEPGSRGGGELRSCGEGGGDLGSAVGAAARKACAAGATAICACDNSG
jgi:hypothetical protein